VSIRLDCYHLAARRAALQSRRKDRPSLTPILVLADRRRVLGLRWRIKPHGGIPSLRGLVAGCSGPGPTFQAPDSRSAGSFFALTPENGQGVHLNTLARVSRIFEAADFRESILKVWDGAEIYRLIEAEDTK